MIYFWFSHAVFLKYLSKRAVRHSLCPSGGLVRTFCLMFFLTLKSFSGEVLPLTISSKDETNMSKLSEPSQTLRYKSSTGANLNFVEYLPEGYLQSSNWPVIIFLHGIGERSKIDPDGFSTNLMSVVKYGPVHYASPVPPGLSHKLPCVILAPQCDKSWIPADIEEFRLWALDHYKIDPKRQYLTGLSLGGRGCNMYCEHYGNELAAVMPICPGEALSLSGAKRLIENHIPLWGAHAIDDKIVKVSKTVTSMNNISIALGGTNNFALPEFSGRTERKTAYFKTSDSSWNWDLGQSSKEGVPQYFSTIYATGGHATWDRMFTNETTYQWLLSQKRSN